MAAFRPLANRNSTATFLASSLGKLELYSQGDRKTKAGSQSQEVPNSFAVYSARAPEAQPTPAVVGVTLGSLRGLCGDRVLDFPTLCQRPGEGGRY